MRSRPIGAFIVALLVLALCGPGRVGAATRTASACLDSSSPSYPADRKIVALLGRYGDPLEPYVFDGGSGVSERFFQYLSRTKCSLIMGFPVDLSDPDPPDGLAFTKPYLTTAYVMVARGTLHQATLRPGMTIAVGMATAPHFYLAGAFGSVPNYVTDTYQTQEQVLDALVARRADAAMVWEPSLVRYRGLHPAARAFFVSKLSIAHARWRIAALCLETDALQARRFAHAIDGLAHSGQLRVITAPYQREKG